MTTPVATLRRVWLADPPAATLPVAWTFETIRQLLERGYRVRRGSAPAAAEDDASVAVVLGQGAARPAGLPASAAYVDAQALTPKEAADEVDRRAWAEGESKPWWKPWFPVIDPQRCTNCMQCLSFCLFDVYGVTAGAKITVANPANCKTDCPACSRVCPEVAIVFPKYRSGPINGEAVSADDVRREVMKVDISSLLGGDIYAVLRDRTERAKSRFSKERDDERALKERQRCLARLQQELQEMDIPASVMAALPSPDQIREKAAQAQRKAQAALAQRDAHGEST